MNKIKVLHIGTSGGRGGIESFILNICNQLDPEKYEFSIISDAKTAAIKEDFTKLGGHIITVPSAVKNKLGYISALWKVIDRDKFDIVHIHKNSLSNPMAIYICKIKKIKKIILHSHNSKPANSNASEKMHNFFRKRISGFDLIKLSCSEKAAEWMFGNDNNYQLIHNGIDISKYKFDDSVRKNKRKELKLDKNDIAICNIGRLSEQKNSKFIIDVFNELKTAEPSAKLFLVGKGDLEEEIKKYADVSPNSKDIIFCGLRSDIPHFLQAMDLFLMPSLYEGLPIAAVEAQAAGLPLLISDTVDSEVKIVKTTEIESLKSDKKIWCEHAIKMIHQTGLNREAISNDNSILNYSIEHTANKIDNIYNL